MKGAGDGDKPRKWSPDDAKAQLLVLNLPEQLELCAQKTEDDEDTPDGVAALKRAMIADSPEDVAKYVKQALQAGVSFSAFSAWSEKRFPRPTANATRSSNALSTIVVDGDSFPGPSKSKSGGVPMTVASAERLEKTRAGQQPADFEWQPENQKTMLKRPTRATA